MARIITGGVLALLCSADVGLILTAGRKLQSTLDGRLVAIGSGAIVQPYGNGSDNGTFVMKVWGWRPDNKDNNAAAPVREGELVLLGSCACTLSTAVGLTDGLLTASDRRADTLVWTAGAGLLASEGAWNEGASAAYSPTGNVPGELQLPHTMGCTHLLLEFGTFSSVTAAGAVVLAC